MKWILLHVVSTVDLCHAAITVHVPAWNRSGGILTIILHDIVISHGMDGYV